MEDARIIDLYWARDQRAIEETQTAYGKYINAIARRVLGDAEDAAECENDTYMGAWNAMPPARPDILKLFLGKITRNLALKKWRDKHAQKRGSGEVALLLDELEEVIPDGSRIDDNLMAEELAGTINAFLATLSEDDRKVFICRYWHLESVKEIAGRFGFGESKVKMILMRTRDKLAKVLEEEGILI